MLKINATQPTCYQDPGYINSDQVVGYFLVNEALPAFEPQRSKLVVGASGLNSHPSAVEAWVAHDGQGKVAGFPVARGWETECENPSWELSPSNPEGFEYDAPDDCETYIPV